MAVKSVLSAGLSTSFTDWEIGMDSITFAFKVSELVRLMSNTSDTVLGRFFRWNHRTVLLSCSLWFSLCIRDVWGTIARNTCQFLLESPRLVAWHHSLCHWNANHYKQICFEEKQTTNTTCTNHLPTWNTLLPDIIRVFGCGWTHSWKI